MISKLALNYNMRDKEIPGVVYTEKEREVWKFCYSRLRELFKTTACKEYMEIVAEFEKHVSFSVDEIP